MRLEKLTEYNICELANRNVCCYERSVSYLEELCQKFELLEQINFVVDDNERNQGSFSLFGKSFPVNNSACLELINWQEYAMVITSDYYQEIFYKLEKMEIVADRLDKVYYFINQETEYDEAYRQKYKDCKLKNIIVFRSGPHASAYIRGMDFSDNARALFEYMLTSGYNEKYELVWLVKNPQDFTQYINIKNVVFLSFNWSVSPNKKERDAYYRAICLAKYLFFTDAYGFARNSRPDQKRIQLWHGCGFKTRVNFSPCEKRYEYTTVISELYAKIHQDIYGLRKDQVLVTGYAKQDWLFNPYGNDVYKYLRIPSDNRYIFWLPTFRVSRQELNHLNEYELNSKTGLPVVNTQERMEKLNELLKCNDCVLIIKLHPFQKKDSVYCGLYSNIVLLDSEKLFENDIQLNRLLARSEALITDYSSAAVDYMLLNKPIAFLLEDMEEYGNSRGFVFENIRDWLPGKEIFSFTGLYEFLQEILRGVDSTCERRLEMKRVMFKYEDNNNCKRIIETLGI